MKYYAVLSIRPVIQELLQEFLELGDVDDQQVESVLTGWKIKYPEYSGDEYTVRIKHNIVPEIHWSEAFMMLFDEANEEVARIGYE